MLTQGVCLDDVSWTFEKIEAIPYHFSAIGLYPGLYFFS